MVKKKKLRSSYFSTILTITLVLFMVGLLGLLLLNAQRLSDYVKENIGFSLVLKENAREVDVIRLQKTLDASDFVKDTRFVGKEEAAKELQETLGEDFVDFLGYNPLQASIDVKLFAAYANPDSVAVLEKDFLENTLIDKVYYQKSLVSLVNENVRKIGVVLLLFAALLLFIFVALINNTIRLKIYSQRFIINTMQLVGATRGFIRGPFVNRGMINGVIGAVLANLLLLGFIYSYQKELSAVISFKDVELIFLLMAFVFIMGIVISGLSTCFAVNRFLKMKFDDLFY